ncbi:unnamed protein product [Sphacelaria rigidula]
MLALHRIIHLSAHARLKLSRCTCMDGLLAVLVYDLRETVLLQSSSSLPWHSLRARQLRCWAYVENQYTLALFPLEHEEFICGRSNRTLTVHHEIALILVWLPYNPNTPIKTP